jgi:glucan phosphorylase
MLTKLYKLAYDLDKKGFHSEAKEIEEVMKLMAKRVGLKVEDLTSLANHFDDLGDTELADKFDNMAKEAKYKEWKGKGTDKPPHKNRPKPPKNWFNEMVKDVKKKNPNYSKKRIDEIVGDIWHNELSDAKIKTIMNKK